MTSPAALPFHLCTKSQTAVRSESARARAAQGAPRGVRTRTVASVTDNNATTVVAFAESCARDLKYIQNIRRGDGSFKLAAVPSPFIYAVVKAPIKTRITGECLRPTSPPFLKTHPQLRYLLANDLAELVHIFKENVVVRHSPNPSGLEVEKNPKYTLSRS